MTGQAATTTGLSSGSSMSGDRNGRIRAQERPQPRRTCPAMPSGRRAVAMASKPDDQRLDRQRAAGRVASATRAPGSTTKNSAPSNAPDTLVMPKIVADEQHRQRALPQEVELADARLEAADQRAGAAGHQRGEPEHLELDRGEVEPEHLARVR